MKKYTIKCEDFSLKASVEYMICGAELVNPKGINLCGRLGGLVQFNCSDAAFLSRFRDWVSNYGLQVIEWIDGGPAIAVEVAPGIVQFADGRLRSNI